MWIRLSRVILRNRILLLSVLGAITVFLGYHARKVEMSYEYASLLPKKDQAYKDYQHFVEIFGQEGNLIIVGVQDSNFFRLDHFNAWKSLCNDLKKVDGVENLLSVSNTYNLEKNKEEKKFEVINTFPDTISTQAELDEYVAEFKRLPFYRKLVYNDETNTYLLAITVNKDKMASKEREDLVEGIQEVCHQFEQKEDVQLHYSGVPYIRVVNSIKIKRELYMFSVLALVICIVVLFLFFRSFKAVFVPVLIVIVGVIWAMGMLSLFGYKITLLSGMIPPLLIVIGIPNSIYMLNKFHHEYVSHGNKIKALQRVIIKIGNATFLTNLTTASGFATFIIVKSDILRQFGIIASLNILGLFVLSLLLIPIIFSFIGAPSSRHVGHLDNKMVSGIIRQLIHITQNYRQLVYFTTIGVIALSIYGISLMKSSGYMLDDIPEDDPVYVDLKFFESNFNGLMPLEIMVDTKKPQGVMQLTTFRKIEQLEDRLAEYPELSTSTSLLNLLKFAKQAFYNGHERYYSLPNNREKNFILQYASTGEENVDLLHSFMDSTRQTTRISIRVKDVGTKKMEELYTQFNADIDSIFTSDKYDVTVTGSSIVSFKGNQYLLRNLFSSLGLAILLISTFMAIMFSSWRMVVLSLTPNIIPLLFTAAVMGFTGIPIKASTILVFSIAFGISVDNTIHFLAKYRQELSLTNWDIRKSVVMALKETGVSMLYTSVVLFFGFGIFTISNFGGTQAMGILVSLTLLVAVTSNLVLLPSLLTGLERITTNEAFKEPLLHIYDEEEDIELDDLEIVPDDELNLGK
ncbi:efflux RND transporter permease subunit [Draconibacterium sp. IB214405]|uniref:efflux RND transporter permease subunit n=1 Tax=Draconibacterium sp. IB214405 TaxID=3097352 RepID=UPI002A0F3015|nr:efflux RND transporter permease subunit [Draconibacterium sp. IB214405]MDX8337616.1 efflux RND transporter permease subunit [Draconibacterium sp. IB214405]